MDNDGKWRMGLSVLQEEFWVATPEQAAKPGFTNTPYFWHIVKAIKKTNKSRKKVAKEKGEALEKKLFTAFFILDEALDNPEAWDYMKFLLECARKDRASRNAS